MTNKPMLSVERELLSSICDDFEAGQHFKACEGASKLRAILDDKYRAPPINIHCHATNVQIIRNEDGSYTLRNKVDQEQNPKITGRVYSFSADETAPAAQHQGEPVALQHMAVAEDGKLRWMTGRKMQDCELYAMPDGLAIRSKLFAEQPNPVAVVMPDDWEDQLFEEMSRRFDLRKHIDDDHMVYDDTQIGVEFARDWIKARLNGVKL